MEEKNYFATSLTKPMGIVFEENDKEVGGIFVLSEQDGTVKPGDQLVAVNTHKVSGLSFDDGIEDVDDHCCPFPPSCLCLCPLPHKLISFSPFRTTHTTHLQRVVRTMLLLMW